MIFDVTISCRSFLLAQSSTKVSASFFDVSGLAVAALITRKLHKKCTLKAIFVRSFAKLLQIHILQKYSKIFTIKLTFRLFV